MGEREREREREGDSAESFFTRKNPQSRVKHSLNKEG
jgi:hypothetical protein